MDLVLDPWKVPLDPGVKGLMSWFLGAYQNFISHIKTISLSVIKLWLTIFIY